jgi:hypothetical protein
MQKRGRFGCGGHSVIPLCAKNTKVFKKGMLSLDLVWIEYGLSLD